MQSQTADFTILVVLISIVGGIVAVGIIMAGVVAVTRIATRHRERMARIGMGINPDGPELPSMPPQPGSSVPSDSAQSWNPYTQADPTTATNPR